MTINDDKEAHAFFSRALSALNECGADYLLGGAFAVFHYTGLFRDTKDLDVYCKHTDAPKILKYFADQGYKTEYTDVRWLAKIFYGDYFIDLIFGNVNNVVRVDDSWFEYSVCSTLFGCDVRIMPVEELFWSKIYVQNRERYDGADMNHILLKSGKDLNWERLFDKLEEHWHLLLSQVIQFQFVYPADYRDIIPKWVFDELIKRAQEQYDLPPPVVKVCRGPLIDQTQYAVDVKEWDYKSYTIVTV